MERIDAPASLRRLAPVYARQDYGRSWIDSTQLLDLNGPGIENVFFRGPIGECEKRDG